MIYAFAKIQTRNVQLIKVLEKKKHQVWRVTTCQQGNFLEGLPIQERAGDVGAVVLDHDGGTEALVLGIADVAAVTGIHGGDEHEP